jgi:hypothetical protein
MLAALAGMGALTLPSLAQAQRRRQPDGPVSIDILARPLAGFQSSDLQRRLFGKLEFRGGIQLSSRYKHFGGVSSIRLEQDGARFLAVTDRGRWLRGRIRYDGKSPVGIEDAEMAPILGPEGRPITARRWYDSESLTVDGDIVYVGIERVHRILWFDFGRNGFLARGQPLRTPPEMRRLPANKGIEGLAVVPEGFPLAGTLIAMSERGLDEAKNIRGFLIGGPSPGLFGVKRRDDFDITDIALLPDGDLLILERSFSLLRGVGMRVRRLSLEDVRPGAVLDGPTLIEADLGYQIDNMEGLSAHRGPNGETVLTMISDDNFSRLQRTLLLQFALLEP